MGKLDGAQLVTIAQGHYIHLLKHTCGTWPLEGLVVGAERCLLRYSTLTARQGFTVKGAIKAFPMVFDAAACIFL